MRFQQTNTSFLEQHSRSANHRQVLQQSHDKHLSHSWAHHAGKNEPSSLAKSSCVELSAKFSRASPALIRNDDARVSAEVDDRRRSNTLEAKRQDNRSLTQLNHENSRNYTNLAVRVHQQQRQRSLGDQCIQEEVIEQSQTSLVSSTGALQRLTMLNNGPSQALAAALDFSFFRSIYDSYNTIWQRVLKLPIYGESHVKRDDFFRVLTQCCGNIFGPSDIDSQSTNNVFCNFLLFSCSSSLKKTARTNNQAVLLLDFRLFLKSVFTTLKRQFNNKGADGSVQERVFHAEMFLVDHFWQYVCQNEQLKVPSAERQNDLNFQANGGKERESLPMELLQLKMFEFFDRRQQPYLLQIQEIEFILTECFKNLIERNKRKDMISKRTFKKVISRHCHGVLCRALTAFLPRSREAERKPNTDHVLVPHSIPLSSPVTDSDQYATSCFTPTQRTSQGYGTVIDHNQLHQPVRQRLQPKSLPRSTAISNTNDTQQNLSDTGQNLYLPSDANRDQKSISNDRDIKQQFYSRAPPRKTQSQPPTTSSKIPRKQTNSLCKQLETKIMIRKLQSAFDSFMSRLAFAAIKLEATPRSVSAQEETPQSSSAIDETLRESASVLQVVGTVQRTIGGEERQLSSSADAIVIGEQNLATKSSEAMTVAVEELPRRFHPVNNASEPMLIQPIQKVELERQNMQLQQQRSQNTSKQEDVSNSHCYRHVSDYSQIDLVRQARPAHHSFGKLNRHGTCVTVDSHMQATAAQTRHDSSIGACSCLHCNKTEHTHLYSYVEPHSQTASQHHTQQHQVLLIQEDSNLTSSVASSTSVDDRRVSEQNLRDHNQQNNHQRRQRRGEVFDRRRNSNQESRTSHERKANYNTASFQDLSGSHDQKGRSRKRERLFKESRQQRDISDQKLPPIDKSENLATQSLLSDGAKGDTNEMLKSILKHETMNGECLKELVQRIQKIEESNKNTQQRREDFSRVQNMRDYMQSPPMVYSLTESMNKVSCHNTAAAVMTFQPNSSSRRSQRKESFQSSHIADKLYSNQQFIQDVDGLDQSPSQDAPSQLTSQEFTYRQASQDLHAQEMAFYQQQQQQQYRQQHPLKQAMQDYSQMYQHTRVQQRPQQPVTTGPPQQHSGYSGQNRRQTSNSSRDSDSNYNENEVQYFNKQNLQGGSSSELILEQSNSDQQSMGNLQSQHEVDMTAGNAGDTSNLLHQQYQHLYEVSREEDRMCSVVPGGSYDDYGDEAEMDFEANKEQRPLQIGRHKEVCLQPNMSISQSSQEAVQTISDPYVNTQAQSKEDDNNLSSSPSQHANMPSYIITTTNSLSKSGTALKTVNTNGDLLQPHRLKQPIHQTSLAACLLNQTNLVNNQASLTYTASQESMTQQQDSLTQNVIHANSGMSAPNLKVMKNLKSEGDSNEDLDPENNAGFTIDSQGHNIHRNVLGGLQANTNRDEEAAPYDPHSYLQTSDNNCYQGSQQSSQAQLAAASKQEVHYLKKYRKAKKQLKLLLKDKREAEERSSAIIAENSVLQSHLQKTAQSAQEVSNHNNVLQNQMRMQKVFYCLRSVLRTRQNQVKGARTGALRRALLIWRSQCDQMRFIEQQHEHQELILNQLKVQEASYRDQIGALHHSMQRMGAKQRATALRTILDKLCSGPRQRRQLKAKAFTDWKWLVKGDSDRLNRLNLQEDLRQVVTQLNTFRIQLVLTKLKATLEAKILSAQSMAFHAVKVSYLQVQLQQRTATIQQQSRKKWTPSQQQASTSRPPTYKSPFMQYLAKVSANYGNNNNMLTMTMNSNPALKTDSDELTTMLAHESNKIITETTDRATLIDQMNYKRKQQLRIGVSGGHAQQSFPHSGQRSQSTVTPQGAALSYAGGQMMKDYYNQVRESERNAPPSSDSRATSAQDEERPPMAHRASHHPTVKSNQLQTTKAQEPAQLKINWRSKSDDNCNRAAKSRQDFRLRMDSRMQKMRQQGQHVEGLVKLHTLFTRLGQRFDHSTKELVFAEILSFNASSARQRQEGYKNNRLALERQSFPMTQKYRSSSQTIPHHGSMAHMSLGSSTSLSHMHMTGGANGGSSFKHSSGSLQLHGTATQANQPGSYEQQMQHATKHGQAPKINSMKRHQRTSSEIQLEAPRIMMGISPSMHNINGPDLQRSATAQEGFQQALAQVCLKNRKIPKPKKWLP